jgi:hypothetical protein
MADAFSARASTRSHVEAAIGKHSLTKNTNNQYTHDDATKYIASINRELKATYNPGDDGNGHGMQDLLDASSPLAKIASTDTTTAAKILQEYRLKAAAINAARATGTDKIPPEITERSDAIDEAALRNLCTQAIIGAKEGATTAIRKEVGNIVTDAVLRTADGSDFKPIDDYHLHELTAAILAGADRPQANDVLSQLSTVLNSKFNFQQRMSTNIERIRSLMARVQSHNVTMDATHIVLLIRANIELAATQPWGNEFVQARQQINAKYSYNHKHDDISFAAILAILNDMDSVRNMARAPAPYAAQPVGSAHSASSPYDSLIDFLNPSDTESEVEHAHAARSRSQSTTRQPSRSTSRSSSHKRSDTDAWKTNPCSFCRLYKRHYIHDDTAVCYFDPDYNHKKRDTEQMQFWAFKLIQDRERTMQQKQKTKQTTKKKRETALSSEEDDDA